MNDTATYYIVAFIKYSALSGCDALRILVKLNLYPPVVVLYV
jgi:hypothetical protein